MDTWVNISICLHCFARLSRPIGPKKLIDIALSRRKLKSTDAALLIIRLTLAMISCFFAGLKIINGSDYNVIRVSIYYVSFHWLDLRLDERHEILVTLP